jgi:hypothetical protein
MIDRRTGGERRRNPRFAVSIEIEWESDEGRKRGAISDISVEGCFVLCDGQVENGNRIKIFLPISEGIKVEFFGEVVNHFYEIGFGMRFTGLGASQREFLEQYVAKLARS